MPSSTTPVRRLIARWSPPPRRLLQFIAGLALCASAVWLSVQAGVGLSPWDVLHAGLSDHLGLSFGAVVILLGLVVLVVSWALGERPGVGTLVNIVSIGWVLDQLLATSWLDGLSDAPMAVRILVVLASVALLGFGGALYIGAGFGAGPRDSLMVACHHHGLPIGASRCAIEVSVLAVGWVLGGPVGLGTVVLALGTGPVVQVSFRLLRQEPPAAAHDCSKDGSRSRGTRCAVRPAGAAAPARAPAGATAL